MSKLKLLMLSIMVSGLTACSSTPDQGGSDGTDLQPLGGDGSVTAQDVQKGEDLDLGVEIIGVESGSGANKGDVMAGDLSGVTDGSNISDKPMQPVVFFGFDQARLSDENMAIVKHYSQVLVDNPDKTVILEGHTDERGTPEYNLALGDRRAKSVEEVMMLFGVSAQRIDTISFGEEQPIEFDHTEQAWQQNRRVEIRIQ